MSTLLRALALSFIGSSLLAQGRPAILRGSVGVAFPSGGTADLWTHGIDGALAVSLPSRGRTSLRLEAAYARFPIDVEKVRTQNGIPTSEAITLKGGSLSAVTGMALIETYITSAGDCSFMGPLPPRLYFLFGGGYAGLLSAAYTATTNTSTFSAPHRQINALGLGFGIGGEWPRSPRWGVFVEARSSHWWESKKQFDINNRWLSGRLGISLVI
jgi:hypothetical protein